MSRFKEKYQKGLLLFILLACGVTPVAESSSHISSAPTILGAPNDRELGLLAIVDQLQHLSAPAAVFQTAVRAFRASDFTQAESLCRQLLLGDPAHADVLQLLGLVFNEQGRAEDAVAKLKEAIDADPNNPMRWTNLGEIYRKQERFSEAVECQRRAISLNAQLPEAHFNLSLALRGTGQRTDAIDCLRRATELRPNYAKAHYFLGNLLREDEQFEGALGAYQAALELRPDWPDVHLNIAATWIALREPSRALAHYQEVLRLDPANGDAEYAVGNTLAILGRIEEAKTALVRAASGANRKTWYADAMSVLVRETLAAGIASSRTAIAEYHTRVQAAVAEFAAEPGELDLANLHTRNAAMPNVALVYYGGDLRPIMEQYAQAIGPHIPRTDLQPRQGKPKLGVVVPRFHEGVFSRCWGGIVERLSRNQLDVRIICWKTGASVLRTMLNLPEHEYVHLPAAIDEAARILSEKEFDWLHYWEIGTDQANYYLPFFRTAPGQSGCWGWPVTSGNPCVDSFLSCDELEPPDGASHYTERLIRLKHLPTYYEPTLVPEAYLQRSHFGLDATRSVYLCSQSLRKYHPDFDSLLADLLRNDPGGQLLVIAHHQEWVTHQLLDRFRRTMPDVLSRIRVMPRMERAEYLGLVSVSDVVLDTLHYGAGANTAYDATAVGTPLVTLPGRFHRMLWAAAVNRRLGQTQMIAGTPEEYVATAIRVANDPDLRHAMRQHILQTGVDLFEDAAVIAEHDEYFSSAIAAMRAT